MVPRTDELATRGWSLHHLGVATRDALGEVPRWETLGYRQKSALIDDPVQRVRVLFLGNGIEGSPLIELVEPADDEAPVMRYLGLSTRFYHLCYEVPDIEAALSTVRAARWLVIQRPVPAAAFDDRAIAWCYTPSKDLIELVEEPRPAPPRS